ncbi:DUF4391 domain-containing protein [uncultured Ellagibacter sp.]|uniref:DUF4391 domain-containing protein n=1 Tax=uncultured Ellagibacter sp. TaxID=2137580 RepID=UPI002622B950|nr:DUF4391 domain-containing protein [uncultured Ellagibacter sp.]
MLGLPSTTEVGRRIPKEAFYGRLKVSAALRQSFIDDVERFVIANSIKTSTTGIPDGESVHEVLVVEVALKARRVPEAVLACVAETNPHKLLFVCTRDHEACLAVMLKRIAVGEWQSVEDVSLTLKATSMDGVWDSIASQVVYGDTGSETATVDERFATDAKLKALRDELARVEARGRKERQVARKNALFDKAKELKRQIAAIEER